MSVEVRILFAPITLCIEAKSPWALGGLLEAVFIFYNCDYF